MATTMKDVARRAGVDISTVSLAINNDPRIRPATRDKIVRIAHELGYRKNHLARGLRSGKSFTIGAVVGYATAFWGEVLAGAQGVLGAQDYHLLLDYAPDETRREATQIDALKAKNVDGLLIVPSDSEWNDPLSGEAMKAMKTVYAELLHQKIPFVFVDRWVSGLDVDIVTADNLQASRTATRHFLALGHKNIAYVYAPHRMNTAQNERLQGYTEEMARIGCPPLLWPAPQPSGERSAEGYATTKARLAGEEGKRVTAIVAATDSTAIGVLRALHEAGLRVPEEVAVLGFGGAFTGAYTHPPLTTVTLPTRPLGAQAAQMLLARVAGDSSAAQHLVLETKLTVRSSCGTLVPNTRVRPLAG
jgi:LacI family transcriptional regulator